MQTKLRTLPLTIDADKIAEGLLEMFTDDERVVLRFGMLPAQKMEILQRQMESSFRERFTLDTGDQCTAYVKRDGDTREVVEFSMKRLVSEAVHEVCLALYKIGDLVV